LAVAEPTRPPVLLLIFRRPELVRRMVTALRTVAPPLVYVAADGPRRGRPEEAIACSQARSELDSIDWNCKVVKLFRDANLGVRDAVSEAISWFFSHEESGIILEDDCLPSPEFFTFAGQLLDLYHDDRRVLQISGASFQPQRRSDSDDYFFSRYNHVWGWATWRRAWKLYRPQMEGVDHFLQVAKRTQFWDSQREQKYWTRIFLDTRDNRVQSWAYRWKFTLWAEGGLCIYPEANMIANVGFGGGATNTRDSDSLKGNRRWETRTGPLRLPQFAIRDRVADRWTFEHLYWGDPWTRTVQRWRKLLRLFRRKP
jgi:hypothetical protein